MPNTGGQEIYAQSLKLADPSGHYQLGAQVVARQQAMQLEARAQAFKETMGQFEMTSSAFNQIAKQRNTAIEQGMEQQRIDAGIEEAKARLEATRQRDIATAKYRQSGGANGARGVSGYGQYNTFTGTSAGTAAPDASTMPAQQPAQYNVADPQLEQNAAAFQAQYGYAIDDTAKNDDKAAMNPDAAAQERGLMTGHAAMKDYAVGQAQSAFIESTPNAPEGTRTDTQGSYAPGTGPQYLEYGATSAVDGGSALYDAQPQPDGPSNALVGAMPSDGKATPAPSAPPTVGVSKETPWETVATSIPGLGFRRRINPNGDIEEQDLRESRKTGDVSPFGAVRVTKASKVGSADNPPPAIPKDGDPPIKGMEGGGTYHGNGIGTFEYADKEGSQYLQQFKWSPTKGAMLPNGMPKKVATRQLAPGELPEAITNGEYTSFPVPTANGGYRYITKRGTMPPPDMPKAGDPPVAGMSKDDDYFEGGTGIAHLDIDGTKFYQVKKWDDTKGRMVPDGQPHKLPDPKPEPGKLPENITVGDQVGVAVPDSKGNWRYKFYQPEPDVAAKINAAKAQGFDVSGYSVANGKLTIRAVAPKDPVKIEGAPEGLAAQMKSLPPATRTTLSRANEVLYDASKYVDPVTSIPKPSPDPAEKAAAMGKPVEQMTAADWDAGYSAAMQKRRMDAAQTINLQLASMGGTAAKGAQWYLAHADQIISGAGASAISPPATQQPPPASTPPPAAMPASSQPAPVAPATPPAAAQRSPDAPRTSAQVLKELLGK